MCKHNWIPIVTQYGEVEGFICSKCRRAESVKHLCSEVNTINFAYGDEHLKKWNEQMSK